MYFFEALQYPFNSKGWISKAVIAALLIFIPIVNIFGAIFLSGYVMRLVREILDGNMELPEFDYGGDFSRGLMVFIFTLVYQIPVFVLSFVLTSAMGRNGMGVASLITTILSLVISVFLMVAYVRYATTEDSGVFWQFGENASILSGNLGTVISYFINAFLYGIVGGIIVGIGFMLCFFPGAILAPMLAFGGAYMLARFAQDLNLSAGKAKNFG